MPRRPSQTESDREVLIVAFPGVQGLDVVGPLEVFAAASEAAAESGSAGYRTRLAGPAPGVVRASSGLALGVDCLYEAVPEEVDTLVVAGGHGTTQAVTDPRILRAVEVAGTRARRITSVCTGAFVLAAAGLLDGRRATTHWSEVDTLARAFPRVSVEPDSIYVQDGPVWTSAGVTAGMDLALALVEADLGRDIALEVSRRMVFFLKRPGGQSQFSAQLAGQIAERDPLRDLQAGIVEHPEQAHTVESLAERVAMSPRHFSRVFTKQVGLSPARFVERVRVEAARRRLEEGLGTVEQVATGVGFGSPETMRRAFLRQLGVGPSAYRERFTSKLGTPSAS